MRCLINHDLDFCLNKNWKNCNSCQKTFKYILKCPICLNFAKCIECTDYQIDINKCPLHDKELKYINNISEECAKCNKKKGDYKCDDCEYSICCQCRGIFNPYPNLSYDIQIQGNQFNSLSKFANYCL